jgi:hypothetical protein
MPPKNSGKQVAPAPKPAPLASDPKFYVSLERLRWTATGLFPVWLVRVRQLTDRPCPSDVSRDAEGPDCACVCDTQEEHLGLHKGELSTSGV